MRRTVRVWGCSPTVQLSSSVFDASDHIVPLLMHFVKTECNELWTVFSAAKNVLRFDWHGPATIIDQVKNVDIELASRSAHILFFTSCQEKIHRHI